MGSGLDGRDPALRIEVVNEALAEDDIVATLAAFAQFGRKAGMARIASSTCHGRENLYRTFRRRDIRLSTFLKFARLAGAQLELRSAAPDGADNFQPEDLMRAGEAV